MHCSTIGMWLAFFSSHALLPAFASSQVSVTSPDGRSEIQVALESGDILCTMLRDGVAFLDEASIGLQLLPPPTEQPSLTEVSRGEFDQQVRPVVPTIAADIRDRYNEVAVRIDDFRQLRLRAYDEGVAFRWETTASADVMTVTSEKISLDSLARTKVWIPVPNGEGFWSHQECTFEQGVLGKVLDNRPRPAPVLFAIENEEYAVLSDVNNEAYPGMWIVGDEAGANAVFPPYPKTETIQNLRNTRVGETEPYIARVPGTMALPWRAVVFDDAKGLLNNAMFYLLSEGSRVDDATWIEPGLVAWDWWNALNITGVEFEAGINQQTYMHYIDFASEHGVPYIILDEGWSRPDPDGLLDVVPEIDMPELVRYAKERGVRLILWMTSTMLKARFDEAFDQFERWGIAGIKVDFMQRDDQPMMELMYRIADAAANAKLLVSFHGGSKPQGITRTYPNVLTVESVMGLEQTKWGGPANPQTSTTLPFTRMVVGPMDYTPGAMRNVNRKQFSASMDRPMSLGTRAHQLAMYVVYVSPLQMLADSPTNYRLFPESTRFIAQLPVTWHETIPLVAEVGDLVAVARRHEDTWFMGALCDWKAREIQVDLDFLGAGEYEATIATDGRNAHRNGEDVKFEQRVLTNSDTLRLNVAPGGGAAAIFRPK